MLDHFQAKNSDAKFQVAQILENAPAGENLQRYHQWNLAIVKFLELSTKNGHNTSLTSDLFETSENKGFNE